MAKTNTTNRYPTTSTPPSPDPLGRRYKSRPLPPLPSQVPLDASDLMPPPLFSTRTRTPQSRTHAGPYNTFSPIPFFRSYPHSHSYTPSLRSTTSSISSSSLSSTSSTPSTREEPFSTSHSKPPSPAPSCYAAISWDPAPQPSLKRKVAPKKESLRSLRKKQSDACLQRVYQAQTLAYLNRRILAPGAVRLGPLYESWDWEV